MSEPGRWTYVLVELARQAHAAGADVVAGEGGGVLGGLLEVVGQARGGQVLVPCHGGLARGQVARQRSPDTLRQPGNTSRSSRRPMLTHRLYRGTHVVALADGVDLVQPHARGRLVRVDVGQRLLAQPLVVAAKAAWRVLLGWRFRGRAQWQSGGGQTPA